MEEKDNVKEINKVYKTEVCSKENKLYKERGHEMSRKKVEI